MSAVLYSECQQFPQPSVNRLGVMAQLQLFFTFLSGLMVQMDISTMNSYDEAIFDKILLVLLCTCPAILVLDPVLEFAYKCGSVINPTDITGVAAIEVSE